MNDVVDISKSIKDKCLSDSLEDCVKEVLGTALSIGIKVENKNPREIIREVEEGKFESMIT